MPSLKRKIAIAKVELRTRQQNKEEKQIIKLQKQRNAALKKAGQHIAKAQAREDLKDAALKKSQAKARLNATKNRKGKKLTSNLKKQSGLLLKDLRGKVEKEARKARKAR